MTTQTPHILILNGPNLNMLGLREPGLYGSQTLADAEQAVTSRAVELGVEVEFVQSNYEGALIDALHAGRTSADGVVINPGGLTHTSVSLRDAVLASELPMVEVHVSNVHAREEFRRHSYLSDIAIAVIAGAGIRGYVYGLETVVAALRA
ncbi:type II 3-dehydroquinate dehydratase [Subtercola sp. YIM 133946]|uniref:type II 3-dehydroquinate dehydratase n=1 Tax=Subtercola sp. YIM 133946 TaxID=3118909 RepID=UPI002F922E7A